MEKIILKPNETRAFNFREDTALINYNETGELRIDIEYSAAFGGGERYHIVNIKGHRINIEVEEKFCEQFDKSYCPMPFFLTNNGFGLYVNTGQPINFAFEDDFILANVPLGTEITLFSGTTEEIISDYMSLFGHPVLPPEYAFLPWISANHWDTQEKVEQQIELLKQYDFPAGVIVLEAWSDEATFYIFNGAKYDAKSEGYLKYEDFSFPEDGPKQV